MSVQHVNDRPIGVFDSGVGGLTVARAIRDMLPNESMIYVGDTAHTPVSYTHLDVYKRQAAYLSQAHLPGKGSTRS